MNSKLCIWSFYLWFQNQLCSNCCAKKKKVEIFNNKIWINFQSWDVFLLGFYISFKDTFGILLLHCFYWWHFGNPFWKMSITFKCPRSFFPHCFRKARCLTPCVHLAFSRIHSNIWRNLWVYFNISFYFMFLSTSDKCCMQVYNTANLCRYVYWYFPMFWMQFSSFKVLLRIFFFSCLLTGILFSSHCLLKTVQLNKTQKKNKQWW